MINLLSLPTQCRRVRDREIGVSIIFHSPVLEIITRIFRISVKALEKQMKKSAGILVYRTKNGFAEVLLAHPGGPYWHRKDLDAWSVPKGEFGEEEDPLDAAKREFREEMGTEIEGDFVAMDPVRMKSGKMIYPFAVEGDFDVSKLVSNTFSLEWPPKSGQHQNFSEVDRAEWFDIKTAFLKLNGAQKKILEEMVDKVFKGNL
jgi:predicted NUDIX family NTP pyrophosphohydrolase